jgi:hypothetical protein
MSTFIHLQELLPAELLFLYGSHSVTDTDIDFNNETITINSTITYNKQDIEIAYQTYITKRDEFEAHYRDQGEITPDYMQELFNWIEKIFNVLNSHFRNV